MTKTHLALSALLILHVVIATVVVINLNQMRQERHGEVELLRQVTTDERNLTHAHRQQVEVYEALLDGLRERDPYVVELLARDRLGFRNQGLREVPPPRLDH